MTARVLPYLLWALALTACNEEVVIRIPRPDVEQAKSMLLLVEAEGVTPSVFAHDLAQDPISITVTPDELADAVAERTAEITALFYICELESLELTPGQLPVLSTVEEGRPIPAQFIASRVYGEPDWKTPPKTPASVARIGLNLQVPNICAEFSMESLPFPNRPGDARFGVTRDGETVVLGSADGQVFSVGPDGVIPLTQLSTTSAIAGGVLGSDGQIWMMGRGGRIASGNETDGWTTQEPMQLARGGSRGWLAASRGAAPFELFAVTNEQSFERFDGQTWTVLFEASGDDQDRRGAVSWIGPNSAVAVGPLRDAVLRYRDGELTTESIGTEDMEYDPVARVFASDDFEIAITKRGNLFRSDNGLWIRITGFPAEHNEPFMAPLWDGVIFGRNAGVLSQYHPGFEPCAAETVAADDIQGIVPLDDGFLLLTRHNVGESIATRITIRNNPLPARCRPPR